MPAEAAIYLAEVDICLPSSGLINLLCANINDRILEVTLWQNALKS